MLSVKSTDPRKKAIVQALKKKSGGTKVTLVRVVGPGVFEGHCQKVELVEKFGFTVKTGKYTSLGNFTVTATEAGLCP